MGCTTGKTLAERPLIYWLPANLVLSFFSMKTSNILLLSALSFISGGMLAIFLLMNVLGPAGQPNSGSSLPNPPSKTIPSATKVPPAPLPPLNLNTEIQPFSLLTPIPQTSNLLPKPEESRQIIDLLRSGFLDSASLISVNLNEQNLNELLTRLNDKVKLSEEAVITPDPKQVSILELLPHNIAYWRPSELSPKETNKWIALYEQWKNQNFEGLILDLRNFKDANDLSGAVSMAGLFIAPQTALFSVEGINTPEQLYKTEHQPLEIKKAFPLLVLINHNTRGTGEALAWSLRHSGGAILIGQATAGEGGLFTETRLKSGRFLRLASARLVTAADAPLLGTSIQPDIIVSTDPVRERLAFSTATKSNLMSLIAEKPSNRRPPDNDSIGLEPQIKPEPETKKTIRDLTLQRAVDVLRGIVLDQRQPDVRGT
jgi:Peptidase family S41